MLQYFRKLKRLLGGGPSLAQELTSSELRERYAAMGIHIGMYTYGCFDPSRFPAGTTVGRYCSFAPTSQVFLRNHGVGYLGLTAYFYNEKLGVVPETTIPTTKLDISDDVWIGHNAVILPDVATIGRGAVIAAGAIVTKPVPAYAIVAGNPARILRHRFEKPVIDQIEATQWWTREPHELRELVTNNPELVFDPASHFSGHPQTGQSNRS